MASALASRVDRRTASPGMSGADGRSVRAAAATGAAPDWSLPLTTVRELHCDTAATNRVSNKPFSDGRSASVGRSPGSRRSVRPGSSDARGWCPG